MHAPTGPSPWEFLIVCSDAHVHKTLITAIYDVGGRANYTSDAAAAMAYVTRRKLDGIFMDTRTEGVFSLTGSIRRGSSNRYAAVFACAGENEDTARLLNGGANFVLHRPLDRADVASVLHSASQMMTGERLRYLRYQFILPVVLKTPEREQKAVTANISRGGMAVRCQQSLKPGSALQFVLDLPAAQPLQGRGEVAWSNTDGEMGIRFYLMGSDVKKTLWQWIEQRSGMQAG